MAVSNGAETLRPVSIKAIRIKRRPRGRGPPCDPTYVCLVLYVFMIYVMLHYIILYNII